MPARQTQAIADVVRYMELRHDAWLAFAAGILEGKIDKLKEAADKQRKANDQVKELTRIVKSR